MNRQCDYIFYFSKDETEKVVEWLYENKIKWGCNTIRRKKDEMDITLYFLAYITKFLACEITLNNGDFKNSNMSLAFIRNVPSCLSFNEFLEKLQVDRII